MCVNVAHFFVCSSSSIDHIYIFEFVMNKQSNDEPYKFEKKREKTRLEINSLFV